jgi:uncharacterized protein (DUF779 family)
MKIQIKLQYLDKVYYSNNTECDEEKVSKCKELIKEITEGQSTYFSIINGFEEYFFTKSILELSIITVIVT